MNNHGTLLVLTIAIFLKRIFRNMLITIMLMLKLEQEKLSSLLFPTRVTLKLTKRESLMPLLMNLV